MGKTADALGVRCRAAWLKSLDGRGNKPVEKAAASVAFPTITLAHKDILNDLRPIPIALTSLRPDGQRRGKARSDSSLQLLEN
jgi:hypothetical protein